MHPDDLRYIDEIRHCLEEGGFRPDVIQIDDINDVVQFRYELSEVDE